MTTESELKAKAALNLPDFNDRFQEAVDSMPLSQAWIEFYWPLSSANPAQPLLSGAKIALAEMASAWALGFGRASAASLRTYVENLFAWLYYKDHPLEFGLVSRFKEDLLLPKGVRTWLSRVDATFDQAYGQLQKSSSRSDDYYYGNISFFIHAHPENVKSTLKVVDSVLSVPPLQEFLAMARSADEFVADHYLSLQRQHWSTIPPVIQHEASKRLAAKLAKFLAT